MVDVKDGKILENHNVWIKNGKIVNVRHGEEDEMNVNPNHGSVNWTVLELTKDHYILPGLIDCHVHVTAFTANFALLEQTSPTYVAARALETLNDMLLRGFTTVRDAGGADHGLARAVQERV